MINRAPRAHLGGEKTCEPIPVGDLEQFGEEWLYECAIGMSPRTVDTRRSLIKKLLWFLRQEESEYCGRPELRKFLYYIRLGHERPGGRWGGAADKGQATRSTREVRPRTLHTYHGNLRTFFTWLVNDGLIKESPMNGIKPPSAQSDQIQPFTDDHITALLAAAKRSKHPKRDEALVLTLLDTGARASEICQLRFRDIDFQGRNCTVLGKGNKSRKLFLDRDTCLAITTYLRQDGRARALIDARRTVHEQYRDMNDPVFLSDNGPNSGRALTRGGLRLLIRRLGKAAHLESVRCSPHTFRHTFSCDFLRNGGNVFALRELLGHTTLTIVNRYVALATADLEKQHRLYSPVGRLRGKGK